MVSIRYIAVLGSQQAQGLILYTPILESFHPLYRGTWFPTIVEMGIWRVTSCCFHPLYRGTWFPT